jgi:hypothetical protein
MAVPEIPRNGKMGSKTGQAMLAMKIAKPTLTRQPV